MTEKVMEKSGNFAAKDL